MSLAWVSAETARDVAGIVVVTVSLLVYGVLQERIMTVGFGPAQELFSASIFLVLCNRFVSHSPARLRLRYIPCMHGDHHGGALPWGICLYAVQPLHQSHE